MCDRERLGRLKEILTGKLVKVHIRAEDPNKARCITGVMAYLTTTPPYIIVLKHPNTDELYIVNWKEVAWIEVP